MNGSDPLAVRLVLRWTLLYTRGLPAEVQERRRLELESDIWEHRQDPGEPKAVRELLGRCLRGIPADVRWRYRTLLEQRGVRQRSQDMATSMRRSWWVILTAVLGATLLTSSAFGAMSGVGDGDNGVDIAFQLIGVVAGVISGGLVIGGLVQRQRSLITGSRLIFVGCVMTLFGGLELIPIGTIVLIGGFWTGNLLLSEGHDAPDLQPVHRQQVDMTRNWYLWLGAAGGLFAVGWIPLVIEGSELTWGYFIWILSWLGAIVTGGIGVVLGALRGLVRHRTRLA